MERQTIGHSETPRQVIRGHVRSLTVNHLVDVAPPARARPPFDTLTITLHWTAVLIVLTLFGSRLLYGQMEDRSWAPALLQVHRSSRDVALMGTFGVAHEIGAWCLFALAGLHAAAALVHHFILRDDVLEAMAPAFRRRGTPDPRARQDGRRHSRPVDIVPNLGPMSDTHTGPPLSRPHRVARPDA